ncbi:MAG: hypothetical protein IT522_11275 [Burkholderiales bacterium]|nr:hypothetical protein [Burkholderiales bacterium]
MNQRTLVADRLYYGLQPVHLRAAMARALTRVVGLPPERARVSGNHLCQDFAMDTAQGTALVDKLVAHGVLTPPGAGQAGYALTAEFVAIAQARIVEPLPRTRARQLVDAARALAARINEDDAHNPLAITALAVYGDFMSRQLRLAELSFGIVVDRRAPTWRTRLGRMQHKAEGAQSLRTAFRALSSFVRVRVVTELPALPRPFSVVYETDRAR